MLDQWRPNVILGTWWVGYGTILTRKTTMTELPRKFGRHNIDVKSRGHYWKFTPWWPESAKLFCVENKKSRTYFALWIIHWIGGSWLSSSCEIILETMIRSTTDPVHLPTNTDSVLKEHHELVQVHSLLLLVSVTQWRFGRWNVNVGHPWAR